MKNIVVEHIFNTDRQHVWRAITEREMMRQWYFDLASFQVEVGFKFDFWGGAPDGIQYQHLCQITEIIPQQKLKYSWQYNGYSGISYVTFELFDENGGTRLKLTHTGIDTFPPDNEALAIHNFEAGWDYIINTSLKDFLAG
jgi:uncharacterized protein YndB with AHSA1/START domain